MKSEEQGNKHGLFLSRAFFFLYYGAAASLYPFLVLYYESLGLSESRIGLLAGIPPLVMLFAAPLWGGLADATQQHRRILLGAIAATVAAVLGLSFTRSFLLLLPVIAVYAFAMAPIMPLVDNTVLALLKDRKDEYGKQRLWGAIGWGVAAPVTGLLVERLDLGWSFYGFLGLMVLSLGVAWRLPVSQVSIGTRFWEGLRLLLSNRQWFAFLGAVFIGGMGMAASGNFLFLHLDDLGATKTLMGLSLTFATLSELPVLFYADRLLARWGARGLLTTALLVFAVRIVSYSFMQDPNLVLVIQLLHGLSFSAMWAAGVSYANQIAPEGLGATAQGLFTSALLGLGGVFGALVGGWLFENIGAVLMFRWVGLAVLLGALLFIIMGRQVAGLAPSLLPGEHGGGDD